MGFDDDHPPSRELLADCVHCGFCLPACPTYVLTGEEMDSPRGRIHIISQVLDGAPLPGAAQLHLDRCLSCLSCVTACPSGVRYDEIIADTRMQVERQAHRSPGERALRGAVFGVFPYPRRLRVARALLVAGERSGLRSLLRRKAVRKHLPGLLRTLDGLAPALGARERIAELVPARGECRGRVGLLTGCVQSVLFSPVNAATARVLAREGFDVVVPARQGCCGALSGHAGREEEAKRFARETVDCFERAGVDTVVVNSAGCGSAMKEYARLLRDDENYADRAEQFSLMTRDFSEFLSLAGSRATRGPVEMTVAYHDACHLAHAQGIRAAPRALLEEVPGLVVREIADPDLCCGSAGVYNLFQREWAGRLGERKAQAVLATGAEALVASNPGCLMQVRAASEELDSPGHAIGYYHLAQILDASLCGTPLAQPTSAPGG
ncbi:MAG: glcF [Acidimicrobiaceae bacterium]|nr:glcF [Acidimicrobiaceae bacterium]